MISVNIAMNIAPFKTRTKIYQIEYCNTRNRMVLVRNSTATTLPVLYFKNLHVADMERLLVNSSQTVSVYGDLSLEHDFVYKYFGGEKGGGEKGGGEKGGSFAAGGTGGLAQSVSVWSLQSTLQYTS
jgi:hypothetical protein